MRPRQGGRVARCARGDHDGMAFQQTPLEFDTSRRRFVVRLHHDSDIRIVYAGGKEKRHAESAARADSCRGKKLRIPIIAGSIGRTGSALPRRTTGFPRTSNAATCRRTWVTAIHTGDPIICRIMAETRTCDSAPEPHRTTLPPHQWSHTTDGKKILEH